ncbi:MAG: hypothetical protein JXC31_00040, partial [Acholeplasmataceae bacterium]|nr:hypothetical protein [Acholeplasmataceae bacterium]
EIKTYEAHDQILSLSRFKGLDMYDTIKKDNQVIPPLDYPYQQEIIIYCGTSEILYPDMVLFEEKIPQTKLMIFKDCPHVFMLLPMKQSDIVHHEIIDSINNLDEKTGIMYNENM